MYLKKGFLLLLLCVTSQVFGFQNTNNATIHSTQSSNSTFVFLDLLLWQIREVSDDNWAQILKPADVNERIQFLDVPFKWDPGFRIGIGYNNTSENPWNIQLYYTGYKTKGVNQASINSGEIHSAFAGNFYANNAAGDGISGPYYHQAGIQWNVVYDTLDLELGRTIKINSILNLRPFVGLKAAVINQNVNTTWQEPYEPTTNANPNPTRITTFSSATENMTNNFKGFGPSFGLDTTWHLFEPANHQLNLIGNFSGAFLGGHWALADVYYDNTPVTITVINDSLTTAAPMAKGYLGMEWISAIKNTHLNIRLGYEGQVWFNQLRYYTFDMGKTNDSLFLQGGVLDFLFTFD